MTDRPVADRSEPHAFTDRRGRNLCDRCDRYIGAAVHADRPVADREPLSRKEVRRLAVEAFIDAHYEVRCDGALELAWYEAHPEQAAAIVAALRAAQPEDDGLDVERLAEALNGTVGRVGWLRSALAGSVEEWRENARVIAAEYARLSESSEGVER